MSHTLLSVSNVVKQFASVRAVDSVSFEVCDGEIFALLGPNGAGKTTMVRMLLNIIRPDGGTIEYRFDSGDQPTASDIGYLPEDRGLYQDVPVLNTLTYFGTIRGMDRSNAASEAIAWLKRLDLADRMHEKIQALSKGNQQKVQFIASILHTPRIAVFDEPFSGLDPINQELFSQIIRDLRERGTTVLLSAHQMQLVERIADRILLMNNGRRVLSGSLDEIRTTSGARNKLTVEFDGTPDLTQLSGHPSVHSVETTNTSQVVIYVKTGAGYSDLLKTLGSHYSVRSIHSEHMSLHDIYLRAIGNTQ